MSRVIGFAITAICLLALTVQAQAPVTVPGAHTVDSARTVTTWAPGTPPYSVEVRSPSQGGVTLWAGSVPDTQYVGTWAWPADSFSVRVMVTGYPFPLEVWLYRPAPPPPVPAPVLSVAPANGSLAGVTVTWDSLPGATGYDVSVVDTLGLVLASQAGITGTEWTFHWSVPDSVTVGALVVAQPGGVVYPPSATVVVKAPSRFPILSALLDWWLALIAEIKNLLSR